MSMDAAWKVYVGDRRFDDNQISNLFLKLKYETVGRFTFDFRPIDGDESYMVVGNTLRIFWGDLHRLDGVIQRVDWDDTQYCYHVFGADIRGFLLDRVNTEPSTVSSYTSDIQTQVQYTGCDFPSNIWTGAGEKIGTYTFHYKLGIQNTIRITGATQNIWHTIVERGTVYEHQNGCLYDATKNWEVNKYAGATLRFVSGACKNNVYNINGNTANRVCIRLPGEPASKYSTQTFASTYTTESGRVLGQMNPDPFFEDAAPLDVMPATTPGEWYDQHSTGGWWSQYAVAVEGGGAVVGNAIQLFDNYTDPSLLAHGGPGISCEGLTCAPFDVEYNYDDPHTRTHYIGFWAKNTSTNGATITVYAGIVLTGDYDGTHRTDSLALGVGFMPITNEWEYYFTPVVSGRYLYNVDTYSLYIDSIVYPPFTTESWQSYMVSGLTVYVDGAPGMFGGDGTTSGTIPGCSRLGDIYEIVTATMERIEPASIAPATLEKDNHIIQYNQTEELSDRTTVVTVIGSGAGSGGGGAGGR